MTESATYSGTMGLLLVLLTLISGCNLFEDENGSVVANLNGPWELNQLFDANGNEIQLIEDEVHTLRFISDDEFGGETSCNQHGGKFRATSFGSFEVSKLVVTEQACSQPSRSGEFLNGLGEADSYEVDNGRLVLEYGDDGRLIFLARLE